MITYTNGAFGAKVKMLGIYLSLWLVYNNITWTLGDTKFLKVLKHLNKKFVYAGRHVILSIYRSDRVCKSLPFFNSHSPTSQKTSDHPPLARRFARKSFMWHGPFLDQVQQLSKILRNTVNEDNIFKVLKETYHGIHHSPPPLPLYIRGLNAVSTTKQFVLQPFSQGN